MPVWLVRGLFKRPVAADVSPFTGAAVLPQNLPSHELMLWVQQKAEGALVLEVLS